MTAQTTEQTRNVNGQKYTISELVEITGLSEQTLKATPNAAIEGIVEANCKAKEAQAQAEKSKGASRVKETPREKLLKKAESKMGAGVEKMLDHVVNGTHYEKETDYSTTDQYMAERYGPVVLAVLYKFGALSQTMQDRVEAMYPNHND